MTSPFTWLKDTLAAAWRWSRTVFLNVVSFLGVAGTELIGYGLGLNWASVIDNPKLLFWWMLAMNAINIVLRLDTRGPVGGKRG
jgi:hypothetical protein